MTLDELQVICDASARGKWAYYGALDGECIIVQRSTQIDLFVTSEESHTSDADCNFIITAKEYLPKLIARLKDIEELAAAYAHPEACWLESEIIGRLRAPY